MLLFLNTVAAWLAAAFAGWLLYQLVQQNGRIMLRLDSIDRQLTRRQPAPAEPDRRGLQPGAAAPAFELPDLDGVPHTLSSFLGQELLLIFFNPGCGFCSSLVADLKAALGVRQPGGPRAVIVTSGDVRSNRDYFNQLELPGPILRQDEMEVATKYQASGTPMAYRIDAAGRIASALAIGAQPILDLVSGGNEDAALRGAATGKPRDPSLARSRINRDGLKAGTAAPDFRLPTLDEEELALSDFSGHRLLLVFSDPECGPCDALAPQLQTLHEQRSDLKVVMISRREPDANRAKARKLGLTFPIALQRQWEVSMKYGMFATPIGYVIDEQGVLASDVAVGVEPILALAGKPALTAVASGDPDRSVIETVAMV